jgi:DUF971 family protein
MSVPAPVEIRLRTRSRLLEVRFDDGACFSLPAEYLRVHSPSAEVQGHGVTTGLLISGKEAVGIRAVEPVGHYAVRLLFDDGHNTGLFTWKYLHELGTGQEERWRTYLERLKNAGITRRELQSEA